MKRFKTIKYSVSKTIFTEEERQIPMWYYKFLLWLFGHEEETLQKIIDEDKKYAWDKAFYNATKKSHSYKEDIMQKKLHELGYEVRCNFPMARMNPELLPTMECVDPSKSWEIIKINNL